MFRFHPGLTALLLAAAWLSGCHRGADSAPPAADPQRINLFGEIRTSDGHGLHDGATIEVRLRPARPEASAVAVTTLQPAGAPPYAFSLVYAPADLAADQRYVLDARARTRNGELTHVSRSPAPLPIGETSVPIDLQISPQQPTSQSDSPVITAYACGPVEVIVQHQGASVTVYGATHTPLQLPRVPAASGTQYRDDAGHRFWSHGQSARLDVDEQVRACQERPAGSRMAAARLAGASVYAVGQEPGWFLTIVPDDRVILVADYGSEVIVAPPAQVKPVAGGWHYRTQSGSGDLRIDVAETPCTDAMSGARWPRTVVVRFEDRELSGCGARWDTARQPAGPPG